MGGVREDREKRNHAVYPLVLDLLYSWKEVKGEYSFTPTGVRNLLSLSFVFFLLLVDADEREATFIHR